MASHHPFRPEDRFVGSSRVPTGAAAKRLRWSLLALYLAFVIYGSLIPLHFVFRPLDEAVAEFVHLPFLDLGIASRADWVANLLLFVPLTLLAGLAMAPAQRRGRAALGVALVLAGAGLAVSIEFVQLYFPNRTVSQNDILAEVLGGLAGVLCHAFLGDRIGRWLDALWAWEGRQARARRLLHAYLLLLFGFSVLPLDLTISPVELYHKWKQGRVVLMPFGGVGADGAAAYQVVSDILVWVPAGLLWIGGGAVGLATVVRRVTLAALAIETFQLFVFSRVSDVTDVFLAMVGAAVGGALGGRGRRHLAALWELPGAAWRRLWWAWLVLVLGVFWFPFSFAWPGGDVAEALSQFMRMPFATYYGTSEFHAINELLRKVAFFLPGGFILGMGAPPGAVPGRLSRLLAPVVAVPLLVEAGQLFLPGKVADPTDALLEAAGGVIGLLIARWLWSAADQPPPPAAAPAAAATWRFPLPAGPWRHVLWIGVPALLLLATVRLPGVPYNVRELVPSGLSGIVAAAALSMTAYLTANAPFLLLWARRGRFPLRAPLVLLVQAVVVWSLLRVAVPMESIHDIVGAPVLDWPLELEEMGRFAALYVAVGLQVVLAAWCVLVSARPALLPQLLFLVVLALGLAWPLYQVVVACAATDNLTELMRDGGSFLAGSSLAAGLFLACLAGSALGAAVVGPTRRGGLALFALAAGGLATVGFWLGAEPAVIKYGRVFSAFQFLLSPDRQHLAAGGGLAVRYVIALGLFVVGLALMQLPGWLTLRNGRAAEVTPRHSA